MSIYSNILDSIARKGAAFFVLVDPDRINDDRLRQFGTVCEKAGADAIMVGSSLLINHTFHIAIRQLKEIVSIPVIIFPGNTLQICEDADAILFLSLISGRNPHYLFGEHVIAAPTLKAVGLEPISTGYMLIESGRTTAAEFMSGTRPIPRDKSEIVMAHALAAEYMGMKLLYLEAGSGADEPVPNTLIENLKRYVSLPIVVGGGIREPETAREKVKAGASVVVIGSALEQNPSEIFIKAFAEAIHAKKT